MANKSTCLDRARAAWGEPLPDWVEALAAEADRTDIKRAAARCGLTRQAASMLLSNTYGARPDRQASKIRAVLTAAVTACPTLGEISTQACQDWRDKAGVWTGTNPMRVQMYRACRECRTNNGGNNDQS